MRYPKLKNALLCRVLVYVVVIGGFMLPVIVTANLGFVPDVIKVIVFLACMLGLLVYMFKNFLLLMGIDLELATFHCHNTARKSFKLPMDFSVERAEKKFKRFGKACKPTELLPCPSLLQYKSCAPWTVYTSGIEKVIVTYATEHLDKTTYKAIFNSAKINSNALKGKKKHRFLDSQQRNSPLNRVTVVVIFAESVEESFRESLYRSVCKDCGDGFNMAVIPCVVDLRDHICVFNNERLPYVGYGYPVKNRGIRIVRNYLFGGKLPLRSSQDVLDPIKELDLEQSLWSFWHHMKEIYEE